MNKVFNTKSYIEFKIKLKHKLKLFSVEISTNSELENMNEINNFIKRLNNSELTHISIGPLVINKSEIEYCFYEVKSKKINISEV